MSDALDKAAALWRAVKGDGCTRAPDWHGRFNACCNAHDADYTTGTDERGRPITRAAADARLAACMRKGAYTPLGGIGLSVLYYLGVRAFGRGRWAGKAPQREAFARAGQGAAMVAHAQIAAGAESKPLLCLKQTW